MVEKRDMRTTSIKINIPDKYDFLEEQFQLIRYVIPERLQNKSSRYNAIYADIRGAVSFPHLVFSHDMIDGDEVDAAYILYPRDIDPLSIVYSRIDSTEMIPRNIEFGVLVGNCGFHVLVKLLMGAYFDQPNQDLFVGRGGKNYIYAKSWQSKKNGKQSHVCLEISLKGETDPKQDYQVFSIQNSAKKFVEKSNPILVSKRRFGGLYGFVLSSNGKSRYMRQLRRNEIENYNGTVYEHDGWDKHPVQLPQHNLNNLQQSRGYIIHGFQEDFQEYLLDLGFVTDSVYREFIRLDTKGINDKLPIEKLKIINVLDVRHNRDVIPTEYYVKFLEGLPYEVKKKGKVKEVISTFGDKVSFKIIDKTQLSDGGPTLLLQDSIGADYDKVGILRAFTDPYKNIYNNPAYHKVPKQFINVNSYSNRDNQSPETVDEYLSYPQLDFDDTNIQRQFMVALFQLHLKNLVINDVEITDHLYGFMQNQQMVFEGYGFIRKRTYTNKGNFTTLLYIEDNQLRFANLQSPEGKLTLKDRFNQSIKNISKKIDNRYQRNSEDMIDVGVTRSYDVIVSKDGIIIEIENLSETVLPDYVEIAKRQREWNNTRPIFEFKLTSKFKEEDDVTLEIHELIQLYDKELTQMGYEGIDMISWARLKKDYKDRIENHISISRLQGLYRKLEMFRKGRTKELKVGEGIWYSEADLSYFVGSAQPERTKLHRANLVRRFYILSDSESVDIKPFMEAMGVQFVKYNEFTVVPYFFNLIDIYVENVQYWMTENSNMKL